MRRPWRPILGSALALAAMGVLGSAGIEMAPALTTSGSKEVRALREPRAHSDSIFRRKSLNMRPELVVTPLVGEEISSKANRYATLGSAPLTELREERDGVVTLRRILVAPDGNFRLTRLGGAGLITVELGLLEVVRHNDAVQLKRGLLRSHSAPPGLSGFPVANAGDHLVLGAGADLVLHNPGAVEAELLVVYVLINPRISAADLAIAPAPRGAVTTESVSP